MTAPDATLDDLGLLLDCLPAPVRRALQQSPRQDPLLEVVLDLGRLPEARFAEGVEDLPAEAVTPEDLALVLDRVGRFGPDNRAGIARTLHRISALRNRQGEVVGLTCRVGRAVVGTIDVIRDTIEAGSSVLLLGRPGVGKTTLLREAARVLADDLRKRVIVVDTSNEIAGDGDIPHPGIGRARRMQVPAPAEQHAVMIEAVENHMPQVIVIDEIGTAAEALAARTIAERGVQLVGTAHGNTLENLMQNPTLSDLVGGIQAVVLSDEEARRRGTQKTVLERKAPPTFDVVVEIQDKDRFVIHRPLAEVVDRRLRGYPTAVELRSRTGDGIGGGVQVQRPLPLEARGLEPAAAPLEREPVRSRERPVTGAGSRERPARAAAGGLFRTAPPLQNGNGHSHSHSHSHSNGHGHGRGNGHVQDVGGRPGLAVTRSPRHHQALDAEVKRPPRVYPYAVSRSKIDRAARELRLTLQLAHRVEEADFVLALKSHEKRQPPQLREAARQGLPFLIVKSNTLAQIEGALRAHFGVVSRRGRDQEREPDLEFAAGVSDGGDDALAVE